MNRLAAFLLCALLAAAVMAAPAPAPRAWGPWFDSWDRPVDPLGDCRFDRSAGKLSIIIPAPTPGRAQIRVLRSSTAPHMTRAVDGDFVAEVRVFGSAPPVLARGDFSHAGLFISDGTREVGRCGVSPGYDWTKPSLLRIVRRGDMLTFQYFRDGKQFYARTSTEKKLPKKLKVGVVAECDPRGGFKAEFDQFNLAPLGGSGR